MDTSINEHPNLSMHELAKSINWSHGKVYSSVKRLTDDGLVNVENAIRNGRSVSIVIYKKCRIFFTTEELDEMRQPGYFDEIEEIIERSRQMRSS